MIVCFLFWVLSLIFFVFCYLFFNFETSRAGIGILVLFKTVQDK